MSNYFYLLPEDLQLMIFNINKNNNKKINIFNHWRMIFLKKKIYHIEEERFGGIRFIFAKRYDDFIYDEEDKSVDGFSDNFLENYDKIKELKERYPEIIIKHLFNPIYDFDYEEARHIERVRRFLYRIS